jgi:acyl-CoA-binding protein
MEDNMAEIQQNMDKAVSIATEIDSLVRSQNFDEAQQKIKELETKKDKGLLSLYGHKTGVDNNVRWRSFGGSVDLIDSYQDIFLKDLKQ